MSTADLQKTVSGTVAADGTCTIRTGPTETNTSWTIGQITVNATAASTSAGTCTAAVYLNEVLVCATITGAQDTATGDPPLTAQPGAQVAIKWEGCTVGSQCTALLTGTQDYPG